MLTITLPFSLDALQAALRRYLSWPALRVGEVVPTKLYGGLSGGLPGGSPVYRLEVGYHIGSGAFEADSKLNVALKCSTNHPGAILSGAAGREARFYRTLAHQLSVRTPRLLLTADDILGEPTAPLVLDASSALAHSWDATPGGQDWVLIEAMPPEGVWPHTQWTATHYHLALEALAEVHAQWWDRPPDLEKYPWVWMPVGVHTGRLVEEARAALVEIGCAPWGKRFFPEDNLDSWFRLLDNPADLLDILTDMPQTLIHGDYWPGNIAMRGEGKRPAVFDWQYVGVGPAAYDLSCFHATSRWWFGRLPLSLVEMRNHYLACLREKLGYKVDRYVFDLGLDAARAWRFATFWPLAILEHHTALLARINYLRATVIEPAAASLRRCEQ